MTRLQRLGALSLGFMLLCAPAAALAQGKVASPATIVPLQACAFDSIGATATPCDSAHPLPVTVSSTGTGAAQVQGTSASAAADDGSNPVKLGCVAAVGGFGSSYALGQRGNVLCTATGSIGMAAVSPTGGLANLSTSGAAVGSATSQALSVEEAGRSFSNITTNATTTVKSGAGYLHTICINTKGASANTAMIYDNTAGSGTKIGTLDTTAAVTCQTYDVRFGTGLTIVTATGTAADLTVSYR